MSNEAITWAYRQAIANAAMKFVLLALADMADEDNSCYPGQSKLAVMTGQSARTVRRHLADLEAGGFIARARRFDERGHRTSDRYVLPLKGLPVNLTTGQSDHRSNQPEVNLASGQSVPTSKGTTAADKGETNRPDRPLVKLATGQIDQVTQRRDISKTQSPKPPSSTRDPGFVRFWDAYPRRVGKAEAFRKFQGALRRGADLEAIIAGAQRYAAANRGTEDRFIAHPATWLHHGRWEDEPTIGKPAATKPAWEA